MKPLSFNCKRLGAGVLLLSALLGFANHYFRWQMFGQFNKEAMIGVFVVLALYLIRVGPTLNEIQEYRQKKARVPPAQVGFRAWVYILTCAIVMLAVALIGPVLRWTQGEPVLKADWVELIIIEALVIIAAIAGWFPVRRLLDRKSDTN